MKSAVRNYALVTGAYWGFTLTDGALRMLVLLHFNPVVQKWLGEHPRFHIHFVPTSSSWLNMVERYFRDITENHIRRGVFRSVDDLERTILEAVERHNKAPRPYIWTAKATDILAKVIRARASLNAPRISRDLH